jgi:small subunit ribosomal protein S18
MARKKGDRRKQAMADRRRPLKKKTSILTTERIDWVDYKDVDLLRRFMSERAKIRARRVTGNSAQQQRAVARAIRVAREMALLPYSVRQVTQRSRGRRDRERGRDEGPLEVPELPESAVPGGDLEDLEVAEVGNGEGELDAVGSDEIAGIGDSGEVVEAAEAELDVEAGAGDDGESAT